MSALHPRDVQELESENVFLTMMRDLREAEQNLRAALDDTRALADRIEATDLSSRCEAGGDVSPSLPATLSGGHPGEIARLLARSHTSLSAWLACGLCQAGIDCDVEGEL